MEQNKILFVFRSLGTGGSQKVQAFVANACVKSGYKVYIISMSEDECSLDLDPNINILTLNYDKVVNNKNNPIKYLISRVNYLLKLRRTCNQINPDLICVFLIDVIRITVLALKGTSYSILGSERGDPSQFKNKKINQYSKALNSCVAVVYQIEQAAKYYNIKSKVVQETIPNPSITRNTNKSIRKKDAEELFIFGAGRLTKQKRFDVLIDAYKIVHEIHPEYRLKIYGNGPELNNLIEKVNILGLTNNVDFMGNVEDIFQDINYKSIFVLTSDYEGIPNVITEALINEVPCISTDCSPGGARLLLNYGECGDIVECGNFKQIANTVVKYIENQDYTDEKIMNGKKYIVKFNPINIENMWLDLFERIINDGRKSS